MLCCVIIFNPYTFKKLGSVLFQVKCFFCIRVCRWMSLVTIRVQPFATCIACGHKPLFLGVGKVQSSLSLHVLVSSGIWTTLPQSPVRLEWSWICGRPSTSLMEAWLAWPPCWRRWVARTTLCPRQQSTDTRPKTRSQTYSWRELTNVLSLTQEMMTYLVWRRCKWAWDKKNHACMTWADGRVIQLLHFISMKRNRGTIPII